MSEECSHNCGSCSSKCDHRDLMAKPNEGSDIKRVIAVASGKGGVGKSLVTSMLAVMAAKKGLRVGILDADITGPSIPKAFGINGGAINGELGILPPKSKTGIEVMSLNILAQNPEDPVVWRGPVIAGCVKQFWSDVSWGPLDVLFVDMPPGTGDVPLTVFQSLPVDGIVVVTSPQELVGMIVEKAVRMAEMMKKKVIGLVENMSYFVCPNCSEKHHIFGQSDIKAIAAKHGIPQVASLPIDPSIAAAVDRGDIESIDLAALQQIVDSI